MELRLSCTNPLIYDYSCMVMVAYKEDLHKYQYLGLHMGYHVMHFDYLVTAVSKIDLFHNNFSPSGEQPEHHKLAHQLWQSTAGCIAIFHKYSCHTKRGGYYKTFDSTKSLGVCYWCVKIPQCGYMEHGLKLTFYVQKHVVALDKCHNPALVLTSQ